MADQNLPNVSRVLVIQTAFLGDIVLTTSFLQNLRSLLPKAEIRLLTTPVGQSLLATNSFGVISVAYDKRGREAGFSGFLRKARELRSFRPELVFCLHRSLRSTLLAKVSGGETRGFREGAGSSLFDHRVRRQIGAYEAEKNHALLAHWAGKTALSLPLFPILSCNEAERAAGRALLGAHQPFVAIAPSSVWATKRWPPERFGALALALWRRHGLRSVIVGGSESHDHAAALLLLRAYQEAARQDDPLPLDLTGKTGLGVLKSVLSEARIVVANDSAPLHMATAVGAPVVGVFGPTTKDLGFFPLARPGRAAVAERLELGCRPCGAHGHRECPLSHFRCMLDLPMEQVLQEAENLLCRP